MSTTIDLTVGDTGVTISGTITQLGLGALDDLTSCTIKFSLLRMSGGVPTPDNPIVDEAAATFGTFTKAANSAQVSYRLQAADVASPVAQSAVRWTFTLPDSGKIHAPCEGSDLTFVRISR